MKSAIIWISVQFHSVSNPSSASYRHAWLSYRQIKQTLFIPVSLSFTLDNWSQNLPFWHFVECRDWENQTIFWAVLNIFPEHLEWYSRKYFSEIFNRFDTMCKCKMWCRDGWQTWWERRKANWDPATQRPWSCSTTKASQYVTFSDDGDGSKICFANFFVFYFFLFFCKTTLDGV
jgi:hypothetical protein